VVQAVLSGGMLLLGVLAERFFGFHFGRRQWAGVIITAFGLAVIAITGGRHTSGVRHYSLAALIAVECGVFALGAALIGISMHGSVGSAAEGLLLGVAAGGAVRGVRHRAEVPSPKPYTGGCMGSSASGLWPRLRLRWWRYP